MPRTKSLQHYPDRYSEIIRECALQAKTITLDPLPRAQALSLRGHWYAFVGSLKAEAQSRQRSKVNLSEADLDVIELYKLQPVVMLDLHDCGDGTIRLTFQSREHSWQAKALATGRVSQSDSKPTASGLDDAAQKLLNIQKEVDKDGND